MIKKNNRTEDTVIVFPRISSRDGPAQTLNKNQFRDHHFEPHNPLHNPLRFGFSEESVDQVGNKQTLKTLVAANTSTRLHRTSQRFRGNFKRPDEATRKLIDRRRRG